MKSTMTVKVLLCEETIPVFVEKLGMDEEFWRAALKLDLKKGVKTYTMFEVEERPAKKPWWRRWW